MHIRCLYMGTTHFHHNALIKTTVLYFFHRSEGAVGFFRGVIPNSLKVAPSAAVTFLVYEEIMKLLKAQ